jgi:putative ABC transport system permease protein
VIGTWWRGLVRRRAARLAAAAAGIAVAVALLASLGAFLTGAQASMTLRATGTVPVDWQVEVQPGGDPAAVLDAVRAAPGTLHAEQVGFGRADGLSASTARASGTTTQTTGAAQLLGLPDGYRAAFPGELRTLAGADQGVLLAQQTAANLGVAPGDTVTIGLLGGPAATVRIDGVVELPAADSLFQKVGAPPGSQPAAPPDNVLLLPAQRWHDLFDPLAGSRPDLARTQLHVARAHDLPADPAAAFVDVTGAARNLEAQTAGAALVGDNLGAVLDAARSDAAYAQVLFLVLGLPGAVLAGLLTAAVTGAGAQRRRQEQALLRARGASGPQLVRLAAVEAATVGVVGSVAGLAAAAVVGGLAFGWAAFGATPGAAAAWVAAAAALGLAIAGLTVLAPAWRDLRGVTVAAGRSSAERPRSPRWLRYGLDVALLALAALVFRLTSSTGYTLVLAPEGVPTISVSTWALAGPVLVWVGTGLLGWRLADLVLGRGRTLVGRGLRPLAGGLAQTVASTLARQRRPLARSVVLLALALSFAASTATFNATYRQQAEVDAKLTNGADVTVTESPGVTVGPAAAAQFAAVPGVRAVEPVQHRFGYVGADLQDLYGVRPSTITGVTALQDTYFQGGTARQLMDVLAARPDSILVSAETVKDFQLLPGDLLNLRLPDGRTGALTSVAFHYVGVVTEFPTAPKDSFFVANADYVAQATGSDAVGAFLVDTGGRDTAAVADRLRALLGPSATVTDIGSTRGRIGSSLTAVDLAGLTRVELGFALVLAAAAGGLVLALGLAERRRSFAIARALGASGRQLRGFVLGEAAVLTAGGMALGALGGWLLSEMLVTVLTGVFDPPPSTIAVPWAYLAGVAVLTVAALGVAAVGAERLARRPTLEVVRRL